MRRGSRRAGAVLECSLVPWDSEIFGFPVAQISRVELAEDAPTGRGAGCVRDVVRQSRRAPGLVPARPHAAPRSPWPSRTVAFGSSRLVYAPRFDAFERCRRATTRHRGGGGDTGGCGRDRGDRPCLRSPRGASCSIDRLPSELSRRRYSTWVRTSFESTRQSVLKAEVDGDLVGFFIVEHRPDRSVYWHLTAIAPEWQGKGMGMSLWQTMLLRHRAEGAIVRRTTISGHNLPIINLYARLGFSFASAQMTFHWLRDPTA